MKFFHLIWCNLKRKKLRTSLTLLSILVAFILFGLLMAIKQALAVVGLSHRAKHYPRTLSGGEQQRVGIARGIVTDPTLLLCDEPTGDLDRKAGNEILDLLQALNREHGKTIIMVTHDPHASARAARTVYLDKGQLSNEPVK